MQMAETHRKATHTYVISTYVYSEKGGGLEEPIKHVCPTYPEHCLIHLMVSTVNNWMLAVTTTQRLPALVSWVVVFLSSLYHTIPHHTTPHHTTPHHTTPHHTTPHHTTPHHTTPHHTTPHHTMCSSPPVFHLHSIVKVADSTA